MSGVTHDNRLRHASYRVTMSRYEMESPGGCFFVRHLPSLPLIPANFFLIAALSHERETNRY